LRVRQWRTRKSFSTLPFPFSRRAHARESREERAVNAKRARQIRRSTAAHPKRYRAAKRAFKRLPDKRLIPRDGEFPLVVGS